MAITQLLWANNAATKLASPLTSSSTSATLATGTGALFPNPSAGQYFLLTLNDALTGLVYEIVKVTARAGDVLTIVRGQEGTSAVSWLANDLAVNMWTRDSATILVQQSQMQANSYCYAADTGTVNNIVMALSPAISAPNPNAPIYFTAANTNTGATTITVNGGTTYNLLGRAKVALQGGEIPANSFCCASYDSNAGAYVLLYSTGGPQQTGSATQSLHAITLGQVVNQSGTAFTTAGTAPNFTLTPNPAITSYLTSQRFNVTFNAVGTTGSNTLNISGLGAKNLKQYDANGAKQPAVIPANWTSDVQYDGTDLVVLDPAPSKTSVVGSMRNGKMSVTAASASGTFTADEIIVETAFGGAAYQLASYSQAINLATTGAGGMDTGSAPVNGYVALYAIYNPSTNARSILATNAATLQGNVYGGANMPAGYTASALIGVWPTNGSSQFKIGFQEDRAVWFAAAAALSSSTVQASYTSLSISGLIPANARTISGELSVNTTATSSSTTVLLVAADANGTGRQQCALGTTSVSGDNNASSFSGLPLITAQTLYYQATSGTGTPTFTINLSGYTF